MDWKKDQFILNTCHLTAWLYTARTQKNFHQLKMLKKLNLFSIDIGLKIWSQSLHLAWSGRAPNCLWWKQISPNITSGQKTVDHGNKSLQISHLNRKLFIMETNFSKYYIWTDSCVMETNFSKYHTWTDHLPCTGHGFSKLKKTKH